jgi:IPT/TIG domain
MQTHPATRFCCIAVVALSMWVLLISACSYPRIGPVPFIGSLNPSSASVGGPAFTITVTGVGFDSSSAIQWNGLNRVTKLQSSSKLTTQINAADIAFLGVATVRVVNSGPSGALLSNAVDFPIN